MRTKKNSLKYIKNVFLGGHGVILIKSKSYNIIKVISIYSFISHFFTMYSDIRRVKKHIKMF